MKFDDILLEIGEFGPYQKKIFYITCLPVVLAAAHVFSVIFTFDIPSFRCAIPGYSNDTYKIQNEVQASLINCTIPPGGIDDMGEYSSCSVFTHDVNVTSSGLYTCNDSCRMTRECNQWVYDKTDYENTIVTEFDLVCDDEIMRSHANMVSFAGSLVGNVVIGIISDLFGRKKAAWIAFVLALIYSIVTFLAPNFYYILAARVFIGVCTRTIFVVVITTGLEMVGPSKRSFTGTVMELYWSAGILLILPVVYLVRRWRYVQLFLGVTTLPLMVIWWFVPESPRWLLQKQRYKEVEVMLKKICKSNNTEMPIGAVDRDTNDEGPQLSIKVMFTHRVLILRFFILFFIWFSVSLLYYGISLNTTNLSGSPYINYLLSAVVELLSYIFLLLIVSRVGRRKLLCCFMYLGSFACLGVIPVVMLAKDDMIINILSNVGKFCVSCAYAVLYVLACELFPTNLRLSGLGVSSIFEATGGIVSPYIADLGLIIGGPLQDAIPMIVFGATSLIAATLALALPETLNRELPETPQDAIDFTKGKYKSNESTDVGDRATTRPPSGNPFVITDMGNSSTQQPTSETSDLAM